MMKHLQIENEIPAKSQNTFEYPSVLRGFRCGTEGCVELSGVLSWGFLSVELMDVLSWGFLVWNRGFFGVEPRVFGVEPRVFWCGTEGFWCRIEGFLVLNWGGVLSWGFSVLNWGLSGLELRDFGGWKGLALLSWTDVGCGTEGDLLSYHFKPRYFMLRSFSCWKLSIIISIESLDIFIE